MQFSKSGQASFLNDARVIGWFSCGSASAVACKLGREKYGAKFHAFYCPIKQEHHDNERFLRECEQWIGCEIKLLKSSEFPSMDIYDVFRKLRFIADKNGASCTKHLKRFVRAAMQLPEDTHIFGYRSDERERIKRFESENPSLWCDWLLAEAGYDQARCHSAVREAGISLPVMYRLGYKNNNCIGCVKGGAGYWNKIRKDFPKEFNAMAEFSRSLGVRLIKQNGQRIFLDELKEDAGNYSVELDISCGPQCTIDSSGMEPFDGKL